MDTAAHGITGTIRFVKVDLSDIVAKTRKYVYAYADNTNIYAYCLNGGAYVNIDVHCVEIEYTK